jgi:hypothetical protein
MKIIGDEVFKVPMVWNRGENMILEFFVCKTNEINPNRDIRELGIVIYDSNEEKRKSKEFRQFDNNNDFDVEEIERLIKYLQKVKRHIKTFNANSKQTEN